MKIQQISRFRLGEQGRGDGYQISGASENVTSSIEAGFTGMYTTVTVSEDVERMLPYVLDCGYDINEKYFYITQIYSRRDAKGRPTPYVHGIVLDEEQTARYFRQPSSFFRFGSENFMDNCNPFQQGKEILPELEELKLKGQERLSVEGVRSKYKLSEEAYEDLLRHMYEAVLSEGTVNLSLGWNGDLASFEEVIKDMMFLAFSSMPMVFRKKITFSNYQVPGLSTRMFTVVPEKFCQKSQGAWFDLVNKTSSQLQADVDGSRFRTQYISYIAAATEEEAARFLAYTDAYLDQLFKHPEMKLVTAIGNALIPAFYSYSDKIREVYFKADNAGKILNALMHVKPDLQEPVEEILGVLLNRAVEMKARINDVQFKNLQKYYLETDAEEYCKAFVAALSTRNEVTVKKLFMESLKEKSSLKTDNFIAGLLEALPDAGDILSEDVVSAIADRYPTTESEELQDFYLDHINSLYSQDMSEEEAGKLIKKAIEFVKKNRDMPSYDRAAMYMERQIGQLVKYKLAIPETVLRQLLQICTGYANTYEIGDAVLDYFMKVYMGEKPEKAAGYYESLLKNDQEVVDRVNALLKEEQSSIQDYYYTERYFPKNEKRIRKAADFKQEFEKIYGYPVYERSFCALTGLFIERLKTDMAKNNTEDGASSDKKAGAGKKRNPDGGSGLHISAIAACGKVQKAQKELDEFLEFVKEPDQEAKVRQEALEVIREAFWTLVDIDTISDTIYKDKLPELMCSNNKCREVSSYWEAMHEFADALKQEDYYIPSWELIVTLTTDKCIRSGEKRRNRIHKVLKESRVPDEQMSFNVLLMKYYDFEKEKLLQTDFLKELTDEQIEEYKAEDVYMMEIHKNLKAELGKYLKKSAKKKSKKGKKDKKFFFLAGGIAAAVLVIAIAAAVLIFLNKQKNDSEADHKTEQSQEIDRKTGSGDTTDKDDIKKNGSDEDKKLDGTEAGEENQTGNEGSK